MPVWVPWPCGQPAGPGSPLRFPTSPFQGRSVGLDTAHYVIPVYDSGTKGGLSTKSKHYRQHGPAAQEVYST